MGLVVLMILLLLRLGVICWCIMGIGKFLFVVFLLFVVCCLLY